MVIGTGAHMVFLNTVTYAKINDVVVPNTIFGIGAILYLANSNAMVRGTSISSTGGGATQFWNAASNAFNDTAPGTTTGYQTSGPMARSGDYTKVILGDATSAGNLQIIDGTSGAIVWSTETSGAGYGGYIEAVAINNDASKFAVCAEPAGAGQILLILDSSFDEVYQDEAGCLGMIFSGDGETLYRDVSINSTGYTQALNMSTYAQTNQPNYQTTQTANSPPLSTLWQTADSTGMVYGLFPAAQGEDGVTLRAQWVALDMAAGTAPPEPQPAIPSKSSRSLTT